MKTKQIAANVNLTKFEVEIVKAAITSVRRANRITDAAFRKLYVKLMHAEFLRQQ